MRLLVISPLFAPMANAEAFCSALFVKALRAAGVDVEVIMSSNCLPGIGTDESMCWRDLRLITHDVPAPDRLNAFARVRFGAKYQVAHWTGWTNDAVSAAERLHSASPFDAVMSRSIPTQAHFAGFWAGRRLGVPWLVNINDPLDFSPFVSDPALRRDWSPGLIDRLWHRRILRSADLLTFPCERLRSHVLADTRRVGRSHDIPHVAMNGARAEVRDRFVIVHAGRLGNNELTSRSADVILEALARLLETRAAQKHLIKLRFVGPTDATLQAAIAARALQDVVEQTGPVSYEESLEEISGANACLLVEGRFKEGVFLPSKLCTYLAAGKPVLALSPAMGNVADLAKQGGILRVNVDDPSDATRALSRLFDAYCARELHRYQPPAAVVDSFRPENVVSRFLDLAGETLAIRLRPESPQNATSRRSDVANPAAPRP